MYDCSTRHCATRHYATRHYATRHYATRHYATRHPCVGNVRFLHRIFVTVCVALFVAQSFAHTADNAIIANRRKLHDEIFSRYLPVRELFIGGNGRHLDTSTSDDILFIRNTLNISTVEEFHASQIEALKDAYKSMDGPNWNSLWAWLLPSDEMDEIDWNAVSQSLVCELTGITCIDTILEVWNETQQEFYNTTVQAVVELNLASASVRGSLPTLLYKLPFLKICNLATSVQMQGGVPLSWRNFRFLESVQLGSLSSARRSGLHFGDLQLLTDTIFSYWHRLQILQLDAVRLTGSLPTNLPASLIQLTLRRNSLHPPTDVLDSNTKENLGVYVLPADFGTHYPNLEVVHLRYNPLGLTTDSVQIGLLDKCPKLWYLNLGATGLHGEIFSRGPPLMQFLLLDVNAGQITGTLARPGLALLTRMQVFDCTGCRLGYDSISKAHHSLDTMTEVSLKYWITLADFKASSTVNLQVSTNAGQVVSQGAAQSTSESAVIDDPGGIQTEFGSGPLPKSFPVSVRSFECDACGFTGVLADQRLGGGSSLPRLASFRVRHNNFTGTYPTWLCDLPTPERMRTIDLTYNVRLDGRLPMCINKHAKLLNLRLSYTSFGGELSKELLAPMTKLEELSIRFANFEGSFEGIEYLVQHGSLLRIFALGNPFTITGSPRTLPAGLLGPQLKALSIGYSDSLQIDIMPDLSPLRDIEVLHMVNIGLTGSLPNISHLHQLHTISLQDNKLSGIFDASLLPEPRWKIVDVWQPFRPDELTDEQYEILLQSPAQYGLAEIEEQSAIGPMSSIDVSGNHALHGTLPKRLCQYTNLYRLSITGCQFTGKLLCDDVCSLPEGIVPGKSITSARLAGYTFDTVVLPVGDLQDNTVAQPQLRYVQASGNLFTGTIPTGLKRCTRLYHVIASSNRLSGALLELPTSLGILDLSYNIDMDGVLPLQYYDGSMSLLSRLRLVSTKIGGPLPWQLFWAPSLEQLDFSNTRIGIEGFSDPMSPFETLVLYNASTPVVYPSIPFDPSTDPIFFARGLSTDQLIQGRALAQEVVSDTLYHICARLACSGFAYNIKSEWEEMNITCMRALQQSKLQSFKISNVGVVDEAGLLLHLLAKVPIQTLDLTNNRIRGCLPPELGYKSGVEQFKIGQNLFGLGPLPLGTTKVLNPDEFPVFEASICGFPKEWLDASMTSDVISDSLNQSIPFEYSVDLTRLVRNSLTSPFFPFLKEADLSYNALASTTEIALSVFAGLPMLNSLDLSANRLWGAPSDASLYLRAMPSTVEATSNTDLSTVYGSTSCAAFISPDAQSPVDSEGGLSLRAKIASHVWSEESIGFPRLQRLNLGDQGLGPAGYNFKHDIQALDVIEPISADVKEQLFGAIGMTGPAFGALWGPIPFSMSQLPSLSYLNLDHSPALWHSSGATTLDSNNVDEQTNTSSQDVLLLSRSVLDVASLSVSAAGSPMLLWHPCPQDVALLEEVWLAAIESAQHLVHIDAGDDDSEDKALTPSEFAKYFYDAMHGEKFIHSSKARTAWRVTMQALRLVAHCRYSPVNDVPQNNMFPLSFASSINHNDTTDVDASSDNLAYATLTASDIYTVALVSPSLSFEMQNDTLSELLTIVDPAFATKAYASGVAQKLRDFLQSDLPSVASVDANTSNTPEVATRLLVELVHTDTSLLHNPRQLSQSVNSNESEKVTLTSVTTSLPPFRVPWSSDDVQTSQRAKELVLPEAKGVAYGVLGGEGTVQTGLQYPLICPVMSRHSSRVDEVYHAAHAYLDCICPKNWYGRGGSCTPCPANSGTLSVGAHTVRDCLCVAGFFAKFSASPEDSSAYTNSMSARLLHALTYVEVSLWKSTNEQMQCLPCTHGTYQAAAGAIEHCTACPEHSTTLDVGASKLIDCLCDAGYQFAYDDTNSADSNTNSNFLCTPCSVSYFKPQIGLHTFCQVCPEGTYSLGAASECINCHSQGISCSNGAVKLIPGWWQPVNQMNRQLSYRSLQSTTANFASLRPSDMFYRCPNPEACTVSSDGLEHSCKEGYDGALCGSCKVEEGYVGVAPYRCHACFDSTAVQATVAAVSLLGVFVLVVLLVWRHAQEKVSLAAIGIRIFLQYLQMLIIFGKDFAYLPDNFRTAFAWEWNVDFQDAGIYPFLCLSRLNSVGSLIFRMSAVLLACSLFAIIFGIIRLFTSDHSAMQKFKHVCATLYLLMVFGVVRWAFSIFRCTEVGSKALLLEAGDIECSVSDHRYVVLVIIAVICLAIHVVAIPWYLGWSLYKLRQTHVGEETLSSIRTVGFLYAGFVLPEHVEKRQKCQQVPRWYQSRWWWMGIVLLRFVIVCAVTSFVENVEIQRVVIFCILISAFAVHVYARPYYHWYHNCLEGLGLLACASIPFLLSAFRGDTITPDAIATSSVGIACIIIHGLFMTFFASMQILYLLPQTQKLIGHSDEGCAIRFRVFVRRIYAQCCCKKQNFSRSQFTKTREPVPSVAQSISSSNSSVKRRVERANTTFSDISAFQPGTEFIQMDTEQYVCNSSSSSYKENSFTPVYTAKPVVSTVSSMTCDSRRASHDPDGSTSDRPFPNDTHWGQVTQTMSFTSSTPPRHTDLVLEDDGQSVPPATPNSRAGLLCNTSHRFTTGDSNESFEGSGHDTIRTQNSSASWKER